MKTKQEIFYKVLSSGRLSASAKDLPDDWCRNYPVGVEVTGKGNSKLMAFSSKAEAMLHAGFNSQRTQSMMKVVRCKVKNPKACARYERILSMGSLSLEELGVFWTDREALWFGVFTQGVPDNTVLCDSITCIE